MMVRDDFVIEVSYRKQIFTPQKVADYIIKHLPGRFADPDDVEALVQESQDRLQEVVTKYGLEMDEVLQSSTSEAGKGLAELVLNHSDRRMRL